MRTPIVLSVHLALGTLLLTSSAVAQVTSSASTQSGTANAGTATGKTLPEHLDEAEDIIESLLDWRHVLTAFNTERDHPKTPTAPANTLITVDRGQVHRLVQFVDAMGTLAPPPTPGRTAPVGDVRAHLVKAQQIADELMPPSAAARPVGTTGAESVITIDRTAIERLEIELDAIEQLLPRSDRI